MRATRRIPQRSAMAALLAFALFSCRDAVEPLAPPAASTSLFESSHSQPVHLDATTPGTPARLVIGGEGLAVAVAMSNHTGTAYEGLALKAFFEQAGARRAAGVLAVDCGGTAGVLAGERNCEQSVALVASNENEGVGTLRAGTAFAIVYLVRTVREGEVQVLDRHVFRVELVEPALDHPNPVHMDATTAQGPRVLEIEGPGLDFVVGMTNHTVYARENVTLQAWIQQGATRRDAGGGAVECGGAAGVLSPGACAAATTFFASNEAEGTGTLVPGDAFLVVRLVARQGGETVVLDVHEIPIELVTGEEVGDELAIIEPSTTTYVSDGSSWTPPNPLAVMITARTCGPRDTFVLPVIAFSEFVAYNGSAWVPIGMTMGAPFVSDVGEKRCLTWTLAWWPGTGFGTGPVQVMLRAYAWGGVVFASPVNSNIVITNP